MSTVNRPRQSDIERLHTIRSAAELFGVSTKTITNWIKAKKLRSTRIGRLVRITPESIRDFINERTP